MVWTFIYNILCVTLVVILAILAVTKGKAVGVAAWTALVIAIGVTGCLGNLSQFETFGLSWTGGFEAKTRELQTTIDNAKATVASLDQLAIVLGKLQVNMLASEGRLGPSPSYLDDQKQVLLAQLQKLGLSDAEISEVAAADSHWVSFDYAIGILRPLMNAGAPMGSGQAVSKIFDGENPPSPSQCEALLNQFKIKDQTARELLADYKYYVATGKQRRPEVWRGRNHWYGAP